MQTININQAGQDLLSLINGVAESGKGIQIDSDKGSVVVMTVGEYQNLKEHVHIGKNKHLINKVHNIENLEFESHNSINSLKQSIDE